VLFRNNILKPSIDEKVVFSDVSFQYRLQSERMGHARTHVWMILTDEQLSTNDDVWVMLSTLKSIFMVLN
jgi:hypothetical protein